jgi:hypothetical protein
MPSEESRQLKRLIGLANLKTGDRAMHRIATKTSRGQN